MATLVLSLQSRRTPWETLSPRTQAELTRWIPREANDAAAVTRLTEQVKDGIQYSPLTAVIETLAVHDVERVATAVYLNADTSDDTERDDVLYKPRSEADLLREFWEGVARYDTVVTFNGRRHVVPFLLHRSAVHHITPSINLLESRYLERQTGVQHVDLLDQLTFYGAQARRPSLYLYCEAYQLPLPPEVPPTASLAQQALVDAETVLCVHRLYEHWQAYLQFTSTDQVLEF